MRNLIRGLAFTAGAYISYAATRAAQAAKLKRKNDEEPTESQAEALPAPTTPQPPKFTPGELVVTVNPYTFDYCYEDFDGTPLYYAVISLSWDDLEGTWRYQLDGEDPQEFFAEEWLESPEHPTFSKSWAEQFYDELNEHHNKSKGDDDMFGGNWGDEFNGLGKAAEKQRKLKAEAERKDAEESRKYKIDCYLDLLAKGTDEDKAVARKRLAELVVDGNATEGE